VSAAEGYQAIRRSRLVAILGASSPDRLVAGAQVLVEEGIQTLELPLTSPDALDAIRRTAELAGGRALVGAGTIRTVDDARRAVDAGAVALGVGSPLSGEALEYGDVDQLRKRTRSWKAAVS